MKGGLCESVEDQRKREMSVEVDVYVGTEV
jgi:hypothetical protein